MQIACQMDMSGFEVDGVNLLELNVNEMRPV
jgi:hypothetical protein